MKSCEREIEMLHHAIIKSGRPMVLSLSPGPALINKAWHYEKYANMWRITDDFWDSWPLLLNMFERCELWQKHVSEGCYPDCDMLPLGFIGKGFKEERYTRFTKEEQITMLTLWCIFRSPLMLGCELTKLDQWTQSILTNRKVLDLLSESTGARQIIRDKQKAIWFSESTKEAAYYLAVFNLSEEEVIIPITPEELEISSFSNYNFEELWSGEYRKCNRATLEIEVPSHGAKLYKIFVG
jgi:hypothetical protein